MLNRLCLMVLLQIIFVAATVQAFDLAQLKHTPPNVELGKEILVSIPAQDLKRARVLVGARDGYSVIPMQQQGEQFKAALNFANLATLMYQFQIETKDGKVLETEYYSIRQPSNKELELLIANLSKEASSLQGKIKQLESSLFALKRVDPKTLGAQKAGEMAKALVLLGKREREYQDIKEMNEARQNKRREELLRTPKGKAVQEGSAAIEQERKRFLSGK